MQDGYAYFAVRVDIWMENAWLEREFWRVQGIVLGEVQSGVENTALVARVWRTHDETIPLEQVRIINWTCKDSFGTILRQFL